MSPFPVNRFAGKGHSDAAGVASSKRLRRVGGIDPNDQEESSMFE
jgi:hypothetical protein